MAARRRVRREQRVRDAQSRSARLLEVNRLVNQVHVQRLPSADRQGGELFMFSPKCWLVLGVAAQSATRTIS